MLSSGIHKRYWRARLLAGAALVAAHSLITVARAQPPADVPIRAPLFTIDAASPTIGGPITASAILQKPGPTVRHPGPALGLNHPADDLDGFSYNRGSVLPSQTFVILFSVDRASIGAASADPDLVTAGKPFNVQHQALRHQAAGDVYMSTSGFTRNGPTPFLLVTPDNNTLGRNGGDTGGVDLDLKPEEPPIVDVNPQPQDELQGMSSPGVPAAVLESGIPGEMLFYSATRNSPSLQMLPGGVPSGANLYVDFNPEGPGGEQLYVGAAQLGLMPGITGDDIDDFIVFDNGNGIFNPGIDQVVFSLSRDSPSIVMPGRGPADLFTSTGGGLFVPYAFASDFGLGELDNIDGLDLLLTNDVNTTVLQSAIRLVLPGDHDHNGVLDDLDCHQFSACYSGAGVSFDDDGPALVNVAVGPGDVFSPPNVTVEVGDTVRWTWMGGTHNVISGLDGSPDGAFNSGPATGTVGNVFNVLFNDAFLNIHTHPNWAFPYYCGVHLNLGVVNVVSDPCATYDLDFDGDVDCADWIKFRIVYEQVNKGEICALLTVPEFVDALLGFPQQPHHLCWADMNLDGKANGLDVRPYLAAILP